MQPADTIADLLPTPPSITRSCNGCLQRTEERTLKAAERRSSSGQKQPLMKSPFSFGVLAETARQLLDQS